MSQVLTLREQIFRGKRVELARQRDAVVIAVNCHDSYEAEVLYDDLHDRLQAGEPITLVISAPPPE